MLDDATPPLKAEAKPKAPPRTSSTSWCNGLTWAITWKPSGRPSIGKKVPATRKSGVTKSAVT